MKSRISELLLNPLLIFGVLTIIQITFWFAFYPSRPSIPLASPKSDEIESIDRFFLSLSVFLLPYFLIGRRSALFSVSKLEKLKKTMSGDLWYVTIVIVVTSSIGGAYYCRDAIATIQSAKIGSFDEIAIQANNGRGIGITTLFHLNIAAGILLGCLKVDNLDPNRRIFHIIISVLFFTVLIFSGVFVAQRQALLATVFAYIASLYTTKTLEVKKLKIVLVCIIFVAPIFIVASEYLRIANSLVGDQVANQLSGRIIEGYVGSDCNNMLQSFSNIPKNGMVDSSSFFTGFRRSVDLINFSDVIGGNQIIGKQFGTENVLGLIWKDWGDACYPVYFFYGTLLSISSKLRSNLVWWWTYPMSISISVTSLRFNQLLSIPTILSFVCLFILFFHRHRTNPDFS